MWHTTTRQKSLQHDVVHAKQSSPLREVGFKPDKQRLASSKHRRDQAFNKKYRSSNVFSIDCTRQITMHTQYSSFEQTGIPLYTRLNRQLRWDIGLQDLRHVASKIDSLSLGGTIVLIVGHCVLRSIALPSVERTFLCWSSNHAGVGSSMQPLAGRVVKKY